MSTSNCTHETRTPKEGGGEEVTSLWNKGVVSLGKYKKRSPTREGYICGGCGLIALPPASSKRAQSWKPPQGKKN